MHDIYPLRGTNKHSEPTYNFHIVHLSPTGDERTLTSTPSPSSNIFIPYGGRTNTICGSCPVIYFIYPLRGTNKPEHVRLFHNMEYLSPTGDEQTKLFYLFFQIELFIPYGGRTNELLYSNKACGG